MTQWYKTAENPPKKSGMYLVIFRLDPLVGEECNLYVDCSVWMNAGDSWTPDPLPQDGRSECERICGFFRGDYDRTVEEDGFYEQRGDKLYRLRPEYWAELPMTPEGRAGNAPEV